MVRLYGREWERSELSERVGRIEQLAEIRPVVVDDGTGRGLRALDVTTGGGLAFRVLVDRALDVSVCSYRGLPVAWSSPVGEVHPAYYEPEGLGWLRSFQGGLFVTCGLDHFGAPSEDAGERLGLHGRVGHLPARAVCSHASWEGDEYLMELRGEVRQARVFGENLVLRRKISTSLGASGLRIEDKVTNEGFEPTPHMLLYHFNLGFPLISAEAELRLETEETVARDEDAEAGLGSWGRFEEPTAGYREQVFRHRPAAESGIVTVEVLNPAVGLRLGLSYRLEELPHLFQWKMMGRGTYVLGIEPANSSGIEGRAAAREREDLPFLEPGETRSYGLSVDLGAI